MKKIILIPFIFLSLLLASDALASEKISSFDVTIKINSDATLDVREEIEYDFSGNYRHGIFRNISIKYEARGGNYNLRISDISVVDEDSSGYRFEKSYFGKYIQLKIGDPDRLVSGKKTYVINYKIKRAINYFDSYDELYWNATGNEWEVPIEESSATVILPEKVEKDNYLRKACFAGTFGSASSCENSEYEYDDNDWIQRIKFEQAGLEPGEGLTIVVGFPLGLVAKPSATELFFETLKDNWVLFTPFITFFILVYLWYTRGRDPKGRETIIAQFDAPDNLTPAEVGTIIDEKTENKDITANIINLAVNGYIKISRIENKIIIFKSDDYVLDKLREEDDNLKDFDKKLMRSLFKNGKKSVKISEIKNHFYKDLRTIEEKIYKSTVSEGYFPENPKKVRGVYLAVGAVIAIFCSAGAGIIWQGRMLAVLSFIISGFMIVVFSFIMPVKTRRGVETKEYILGLKKYLEVAEKERIKFHNAPAKNPDHFEKLLPFAMVLGVEKEWAKQFEGVYNKQPDWYSDPTHTGFNSLILVNSLNGFTSSAKSALASTPASASGGGSGFSGGGFSGGGFGGGGGGSW